MNIRLWYLTHKWTSLICTLFLLMLCLTGLPLVFHKEIDAFSGVIEAPLMAADTPDAPMDTIVATAKKARPNEVIQFMFWDADEHPHITYVSMAKRMDAPPDTFDTVLIDSRTAKILDVPPPDEGFMHIMLKLHTDMFAGLPGSLFLGLMGLLFVAAIISGFVLYYPFMRKLDFGTVRKDKTPHLKWLDVHNLIGIVTIVWVLVVGLTGTINTLSQIIIQVWQQDQMADMLQPYKLLPPPTSIGSLELAVHTARQTICRIPRQHVLQPAPLCGIYERQYSSNFAPAQTSLD
jgi:uncharacterized iron-regulated membrane protein